MLKLAPHLRDSVVDRLTAYLRDQILRGALAPGARLPTEAALADQVGVGRSTVREALSRLASAGLIETPHGGSRTVRDFRDHVGLEVLATLVADPDGQIDLDVVRAVTEMRSALAPDVARLAALRRTDAHLQELDHTIHDLQGQEDLAQRLLISITFWSTLVRASGNLAYRLAFNSLLGTYRDGRPLMTSIIAAELRYTDGYLAVIDAVRRSDAPSASRHATALVDLGAQAIYAAIQAAGGSR